MSNEVWEEIYHSLAELIQAHRTTLVFVNTRRMVERVTHHLSELLGADAVTSHHGSLSAKLRLDAEDRLKRGELKALVATASLELGIDIGSVDLVCQLGTTRSIATLLQRVGRAEHNRGGLPKGRLFPLSRDELIECAALLRCVHRGELDRLSIPEKPLDVLAQQLVAAASTGDWDENEFFDLVCSAWPYGNLTRAEFDQVVRMLAEGFSTKRGRRSALIHHDAINHRLRGRRGARLTALTSGGAIPDNADYRVILEPSETFVGTVNEDFAVESLAGDIFQLGNASWRILRVNSGVVRVEDAKGQPPGIPFWLGEAPARTNELSCAVSNLRMEIEKRLSAVEAENFAAEIEEWVAKEFQLPQNAAEQVAAYFADAYRSLGVIPPQQRMESENLLAAVFPDQLACLEHIVGDREIPDHPLVKQTIDDCLTEAMDIDGLEEVLRRIEHGEIRCIARDLPEPSPLAAEILNARPYAFLDNAPLEERRTQAVYMRRSSERNGNDGLGVLDVAAIHKVQNEAWPEATNADELHDTLMLLGVMTQEEAAVSIHHEGNGVAAERFLNELVASKRATQLRFAERTFWVAAERLPMLQAIYEKALLAPQLSAPESAQGQPWERAAAIRELLRGRMEVCGAVTPNALAETLGLARSES